MYHEPLIKALIAHPLMQRLKYIDQSGPNPYFDATIPPFSRFEHSIGVYTLVRNAGGNIKEQTAALLHDASHSAFSHLIDLIKGVAEQDLSYQDIVHLDFLKAMKVEKIINQFDIALYELDTHLPSYQRLEQPLPDLCADRIQYILCSGLKWKKISYHQMQFVIKHLAFEDSVWYLKNKKAALIIGNLSLYFTRHMWGSAANFMLYHHFSKALIEAINQGLLTEHELEYGTDKVILEKVRSSSSDVIQQKLALCSYGSSAFKIVDHSKKHDILYKPKCRGVDPLFIDSNGILKRLSDDDTLYAQTFNELKQWCAQGTAIEFLL